MINTTENHTVGLTLQNSFGVIAEQDGVEIEINIRQSKEDYASFEFYDTETGGDEWYAEGGLWFKGKELVDYDGVFELPTEVISILEKGGYNCEHAK